MPNFQFIVSDPTKRKAYKVEVDQDKAVGLVGKIIGQKFNGDILGLSGYELQVTGGTDKDGFPMHVQVHGPGRKRIVLSHPPGFHPKMKGQRRRKMVRGNTISRDIRQINCKVVKAGTKALDQLIKKEEKPKEEKAEEKKPEKKEEKKVEKKEAPKKEEKRPEEKPKEEPKKEEKIEEQKPDEKKEPPKEEKKEQPKLEEKPKEEPKKEEKPKEAPKKEGG